MNLWYLIYRSKKSPRHTREDFKKNLFLTNASAIMPPSSCCGLSNFTCINIKLLKGRKKRLFERKKISFKKDHLSHF